MERTLRRTMTARRDALTAALGDGWVPVSERLPDTSREVVVWNNNRLIGCYGGFGSVWRETLHGEQIYNVTHWLDLQPPKGEGK